MEKITNTSKKKGKKTNESIITTITKKAIQETLNEKKLTALFYNAKYAEYLCGTSPSESFHSQLEYYKNKRCSRVSYELLVFLLYVKVYTYNSSKIQKRTKQKFEIPEAKADLNYIAPYETSNSKTSIKTLLNLGFKPKNDPLAIWTQKEDEVLLESLKQIQLGELIPHTLDFYYFISHYMLDRSHSPWEVEKRMEHHIREKTEKINKK